MFCARLILAFLITVAATSAFAQAPVNYVISFPAPEHHWMQVEVTFRELPAGPLQIRMSRTSPGRYALHEFAKNVYDVRISDGDGNSLIATRPNLHQWDVTGHDGTVVVRYRVFGDRIDGTYLGVDSTHGHMNIPASLVWARGLHNRPARVRFEQPPGREWRVATQLYPTDDPLTFTAPNFYYLMDSPTEFSGFSLRTFTVPNTPGAGAPTFRIALHHDGSDADADAFAKDTERIVRETHAIFSDFPNFENNTYTFLADYLPWASGDGMEHRNSTVLSSSGALRNPSQRAGLLGTVAHEFFHAWNMERIRARDLEPFDFEDADVSAELWFGEGVTSYYDDLIMRRTGLAPFEQTLGSFANIVNAVTLSPARQFRSAEDMSRLAPFVDAAVSVDPTAWENTFISYYTFGAALGLGLDLMLRDRSEGRTTLDTLMQALWARHGRPGQKEPGVVATPYTTNDLENALAEISGDPQFAKSFFARFVQGHEAIDYAPLLLRAGLVLRTSKPDSAAIVGSRLEFGRSAGMRVEAPVTFDSPLYQAGVERDDLIVSLDGFKMTSEKALRGVLSKHKPGDEVPIRFVRRSGETVKSTLKLEADRHAEIVPLEKTGGKLTEAQKQFRDAWLGSKQK